MSKLFDTLEQIRENEANTVSQSGGEVKTASVPVKKPVKKPHFAFGRGRVAQRFIVPIVVLVLVGVGIYAALPWLGKDRGIRVSTVAVQNQATPETKATATPAATEKNKQDTAALAVEDSGHEEPLPPTAEAAPAIQPHPGAVRMNNRGVSLVKDGEYMEALHLFTEARKDAPDAIEPLINLAVAYTEFGLSEKGMTYFEKAFALDPVNPDLLNNLAMLDRAGLLHSKVIKRESFEGLVAPPGELNNEP